MKTTVLLLFAMFILSSCNSEEAKTINNAGTTSGSGTNSGADISGIDVKGLVASRFGKMGVCTQLGANYYRTYVTHSDSGPNFHIVLHFITFAEAAHCDGNYYETNVYEVIYTLDKAVITENGHVKLELTVNSHDPDPTVGNFDDYNSNLTSVVNGQKDYWSIQLDLTQKDSDMVLPRGQDFLSFSSAETPNEGEETYVPITYLE